jgi:hypothetical protein
VLNDVVVLIMIVHVVKYLSEYVMVKKVEYLLMYFHAYILLDLNDVMMNLKQLLLVMEMYVQLKMMLMCYCHFEMMMLMLMPMMMMMMMNLFFLMVLNNKIK